MADGPNLTALTSQVVANYVSNNFVEVGDLTGLVRVVHTALNGLGEVPEAEPLKPAVPIRKSVTPDYIISLETGEKFKSLKRHLTRHGMTPEEYRRKWGLRPDYPMVCANYSAARSMMAKSYGLGTANGMTRKATA